MDKLKRIAAQLDAAKSISTKVIILNKMLRYDILVDVAKHELSTMIFDLNKDAHIVSWIIKHVARKGFRVERCEPLSPNWQFGDTKPCILLIT
jgi:hypothetical protein